MTFQPLRLVALALLAAPALSQGLDIYPAYHPDGPDSGYIEIEMGTEVTLELNLPGLDHQASLPFAPTHINYVAVGTSVLSTPIQISPSAQIWINPSNYLLFPVGDSLKMKATLPVNPSSAGKQLPVQVLDVDLLDPLLTIHASPLYEVGLLQPIPDYADEMIPLGADAPGTVSVAKINKQYWFTHTAPGGLQTIYVLDTGILQVRQGMPILIDPINWTLPVVLGGFHYSQQGVKYKPLEFLAYGTHTMTSEDLTGNTVKLEFRDEVPKASGVGTTVHTRAIEYTMVGRSMKIHAYQTDDGHYGDDGYSSFGLGEMVNMDFVTTFKQVRIPFMDQIGIMVNGKGAFISQFIDLFQSNAQRHQEAAYFSVSFLGVNTETMHYVPNTEGRCMTIDETGWVTTSYDVKDTFVRTTYPQGKFAHLFDNFVGVALPKETHTPLNYQYDMFNIQRLQNWGMKDVLMWKTHWMNFGQNRRATTHTPADPTGGTDAEFAAMVQQAVSGGWRTALYTDFYSLDQAQGFDENPNFSEIGPNYINWDDSVKDFQGKYRLGYSIGEDASQAHSNLYYTRLLAPKRALKHFEREAAVMTSVYGVNANYFDVMTISAPDLIVTGNGQNQGVISGDHRSPNDGTLGDAINSYRHLFLGSGEAVQGPVIGESSFWLFSRRWDTFYMGFLDGAWRTMSTGGPPSQPGFAGEDQPIMPDYEINVVRKSMPGLFGMGQYNRFFAGNSYPVPYADEPLYEYRATEISYGHNGYMMTLSTPENGNDYLKWASQIKEYYSMRSIPDEWNASTSTTVEYRDGTIPGGWMNLTDAIRTDLDLKHPVVRLTYDNGLVVIVNHSAVNISESGKTIPTHGWYATNPVTGFLSESVLDPVSGLRTDHVVCADYEMADGNGTAHNFGGSIGTTTDLKVVIFSPAKTLIEEPNGDITVQ
jgi:hypothetical protein